MSLDEAIMLTLCSTLMSCSVSSSRTERVPRRSLSLRGLASDSPSTGVGLATMDWSNLMYNSAPSLSRMCKSSGVDCTSFWLGPYAVT
ncbi:hypothetical protein D3C80_1752150 [compost metagenome]